MKSIVIEHMDLKQIADSGQCFNWRALGTDQYCIEAFGTYLLASQEGQRFTFSCSEEEFEQLWRGYFDLERDYGELKGRIDPEDGYLREAAAYGGGIRVLRQDLWEVMVSFLISQNNNIPRIRNSIRQLQRRFGEKLGSCGAQGGEGGPEEEFYSFPGPDRLAKAAKGDFEEAGLGYRAKYLERLAGELKGDGLRDLKKQLEAMGDEEAREKLMSYFGIGRKVADCICLFGLHRTAMFPVDTHIKKIITQHYDGSFPFDRYQGDLGIYQQYMFYFDLKK